MSRIQKLQKIYDLHQKWTEGSSFFCKKGCDKCCTINIAATSLEAELIMNKIGQTLKKKLENYLEHERFMPKTTINAIANISMTDLDIPEEYIPFTEVKCPFLFENECMIYDIRPLACRVQLSFADCSKTEISEIDERTMSINNIFQQYTELLDYDGLSGNIIDLIVHGANPLFTSKFIENQTPRALMVPPEFQDELKELIQELNSIIRS
ncbi:MAG: YkgJ family cysteine cluster protein [Desulfobacteraceae bacterium]|nr:YkgJ family cysteine cluster protein [Desulfobacteraceae bacterium]MCB9494141.1 YkgJ family cysteine cluster protein [Desulfobacteraceae bacterium]